MIEEKHLIIYTMYLHGPMDYAKKRKLRFRVGDLDLRKIYFEVYTSKREEEDMDAHMCPCGTLEQDSHSRRM